MSEYEYTPEQIKELEDAISTQPWGRHIIQERDQLRRELEKAREGCRILDEERRLVHKERDKAVAALSKARAVFVPFTTSSEEEFRTKITNQITEAIGVLEEAVASLDGGGGV